MAHEYVINRTRIEFKARSLMASRPIAAANHKDHPPDRVCARYGLVRFPSRPLR
jgi:hypothetical protein